MVEEKLDRIFAKPWTIVVLFIIYCWIVYFSGWQMKWFVSDFSFTFAGLMVSIYICILMVYICKKTPRIGWLNFIGKNSLVFYMLCGGYPNLMAVLCNKISSNTTLNVVASTIFSIILAYLTTLIINKHLPFLVDMRKIRKTI